ncbi:MAG: PorT family protein [Bernardetiaceae bacterium]|jgi:hypothetical protein|nr:PorT family protein [Bernardetiaceae bacterium]
MKKALLPLCFLALIATQPVVAQDSPLGIGVYIGPSIDWLRTDARAARPDGSIVGMEWGLMLEYMINERYIIHSGVNISHRGGKLGYAEGLQLLTNNAVDLAGNTGVTYNVQFIEIPLQMRLRVTQGTGKVLPFVQFGFNGGFRVGGRANITNGNRTISREPVRRDVNDFAFGLVAGAGVEYQINQNNRLLAAVLFGNGFTDVINRHSRPNGLERVAHNYVNFRMGFFF